MSILSIISTIIEPVTNLIDDLTTSDEERLEAKAKIKQIENNLAVKMMEYEQNVITKKAEIMVAELDQSDNYTKRARPTIVYAGLAILAINNIVLPWVTHFLGEVIPKIDIPSEFWIAWGGVTGVYAFQRTQEKIKKAN